MALPTDPPQTARPLTKIVATIGPATSSADAIRQLIQAGVCVFRFNFSHGTLETHGESLRHIRIAAEELGEQTAVFGDLQGPKIRIGKVAGEGIEVETGSSVFLQRDPIVAEPDRSPRFSSTYHELIDDVEPGQRLLVNDGAVRLLIVHKSSDELTCTVMNGGIISSGKGINLPDTDLSVNTLTERDWSHVTWSIEQGLDVLALSFVRSGEDVLELAAGIQRISQERLGRTIRMPIIAKIEVPQAVEEIQSIVKAADAIMVARGDLGVEMDLAEVPIIQKQLVAIAHNHGKPCIIATQMLESMLHAPAPTRAEANDVANAIFDQVDAVMLSGETAVGRYPLIAVEHMRRIAERAEAHIASTPSVAAPPAELVKSRYHTAALAHGVWTIARDIGARFIAVWSQHGGGARYLSQNNFHIPIIAITSDERVARHMQLLRGVTPVRMDVPSGVEEFSRFVNRYVQDTGWAVPGDPCILLAGEPLGRPGVTNSLSLYIVGDAEKGFKRYRS